MAYATFAQPATLIIDPALLAAARRTLHQAATAAAVLLQSVAVAATLWLILAGPGVLTDTASNAPNPRTIVAN